MATFERFPLPFGQLAELLGVQVARFLEVDDPAAALPSVGLRETVQIWQQTDRELTSLAKAEATGIWHHQISLDGEPALYARSRASHRGEAGHPTWLITEVADAPLVELFDRAVRALDQRDDLGGAVGRLLRIPRQQLFALWLHWDDDREDRLLPLQATTTTQRYLDVDLPNREVLPPLFAESAFLSAFRGRPDLFGLTAAGGEDG